MNVVTELRSVPQPPASVAQLPDEDLVLLIRRGHSAAFGELLRRYQPLLLGYATRFLGDRSVAADVTQDVFLSFWVERQRYRYLGRLRAYLLAMAFNRCQVAARARRNHLRKVEKASAALPPVAAADTPLDQLLHAARAEEVRQQLRQLPVMRKHVLILRYTSELSLAEIAQSTGKSLGTIKSHLSRGLAALSHLLRGRS
ncbi:MAG: sigma-70 family RNA polymerase sigma factor [Deltaproteobacteria bacterium]|nr:sigma-70 family RNA polymerase sigma factor [Deltaproteobacteria bacterium]